MRDLQRPCRNHCHDADHNKRALCCGAIHLQLPFEGEDGDVVLLAEGLCWVGDDFGGVRAQCAGRNWDPAASQLSPIGISPKTNQLRQTERSFVPTSFQADAFEGLKDPNRNRQPCSWPACGDQRRMGVEQAGFTGFTLKLLGCCSVYRLREQKSLNEIAAQLIQTALLFLGLDAFGDDLQSEG